MRMSIFRSAWSVRVMAFGFTALLVHSVAPQAHGTPVINCGGPQGGTCRECCCPPGTTFEQCAACRAARSSCCETVPWDCTPPGMLPVKAATPPIRFKGAIGAVKLQFKRDELKNGLVDLKLKNGLVLPGIAKPTVSIGAQLSGTDASLGSLLYPVAFLALGESAIDTLQARGYDVAIAKGGASQTCQELMSSDWCTSLAKQLAQSIYALIQVGDEAEREGFLEGINALGFGPCNTRG